MFTDSTVFVIDDDGHVLHALRELIESVGLRVRAFASAREFLDQYDPSEPGCLLLDVRLLGMSGLELQRKLIARKAQIPIIFITAYADVPMAVQAMQMGAVDFLEKPFRDQALLDCLYRALERDQAIRQAAARKAEIRKNFEQLTPMERQVACRLAEGKSNKAIALELKISQKTVDFHRANLLAKMQAESVPQLVRLIVLAELL